VKGEKGLENQPVVVWRREERVLTLEGEPVLQLQLNWPELEGGGRGGKWLSRYYRKVARTWKDRWEKELYLRACLDLVELRGQSKPFRVWAARLTGEVTHQQPQLLSIRMEAREMGRGGRALVVCTGDIWNMPQASPCTLEQLYFGRRGWRKQLLGQLEEQGQRQLAAGECFLDRDFSKKLKQLLRPGRYCIRGECLEFYGPQCLLAPAAQEIAVFPLARGKEGWAMPTEKIKKGKKG